MSLSVAVLSAWVEDWRQGLPEGQHREPHLPFQVRPTKCPVHPVQQEPSQSYCSLCVKTVTPGPPGWTDTPSKLMQHPFALAGCGRTCRSKVADYLNPECPLLLVVPADESPHQHENSTLEDAVGSLAIGGSGAGRQVEADEPPCLPGSRRDGPYPPFMPQSASLFDSPKVVQPTNQSN